MSRSIKKGPFIEKSLYKKVLDVSKTGDKRMIKTYSRCSTVISEMVGLTISVYNGKTWIPVYVTEFSPTRLFRGHAGSDRKVTRH